MQSKEDSEVTRQARVRQLWLARAPEERNAAGVLIFYGWLAHHYPELLKRGKGDPYQYLKVDLNGLIRES
jgi:hypothetical protein